MVSNPMSDRISEGCGETNTSLKAKTKSKSPKKAMASLFNSKSKTKSSGRDSTRALISSSSGGSFVAPPPPSGFGTPLPTELVRCSITGNIHERVAQPQQMRGSFGLQSVTPTGDLMNSMGSLINSFSDDAPGYGSRRPSDCNAQISLRERTLEKSLSVSNLGPRASFYEYGNNNSFSSIGPSSGLQPNHSIARVPSIRTLGQRRQLSVGVPIEEQYAKNKQLLNLFELVLADQLWFHSFEIGANFVENATIEIPKHGYYHSPRHENDRQQSSFDALRVSHLLLQLVVPHISNNDLIQIVDVNSGPTSQISPEDKRKHLMLEATWLHKLAKELSDSSTLHQFNERKDQLYLDALKSTTKRQPNKSDQHPLTMEQIKQDMKNLSICGFLPSNLSIQTTTNNQPSQPPPPPQVPKPGGPKIYPSVNGFRGDAVPSWDTHIPHATFIGTSHPSIKNPSRIIGTSKSPLIFSPLYHLPPQ